MRVKKAAYSNALRWFPLGNDFEAPERVVVVLVVVGGYSLVKRKSISELIYCVSMETTQFNGLTLEKIR